MRLVEVRIRNYRSIESVDLGFDPRCRILVGINESGKTNILQALKLLDPRVTPAQRDIREAGRTEPQITEAYVNFVFDLTSEEIDVLYAAGRTICLAEDYSAPIVTVGGKSQNLRQFCESRQALYFVELQSFTKHFTTWTLSDGEISADWRKVSNECPEDYVVPGLERAGFLKAYSLVNIRMPSAGQIPHDYLAQPSVEDLSKRLDMGINGIAASGLLKVLFWDYDETKLLPPRINLDSFAADPESCLPLKRMFRLYGISNIKSEIDKVKSGSANALNNLLSRVAARTSLHFHNTWKEYDNVKFSLRMDGPEVIAGIEDHSNHYELVQRSDGFKRFVTFLLLVSAEDASGLLKDWLLLIDEPETGLHPTGSRYLMKELISLSRHNYVVFSTHSIFMIDNEIIARHLIVKKENEITRTDVVTESNLQDEEVIFKSLGYSIFSNLREKNLLFEGWRDKRLFDVAMTNLPAGFQDLEELRSLGRCFSHGVKDIKNITPMFQAGSRQCFILTDNDPVAKQRQIEYLNEKGYGSWKRYDELVPTINATTGEDFVNPSAILLAANEVLSERKLSQMSETDIGLMGTTERSLKRWLDVNGASGSDQILKAIKDRIFDDLTSASIVPAYYDYLKAVLVFTKSSPAN